MTEVLDTYTAGTSADDFAEADLPDETAGQEVSEGAPWGFTKDPVTGEERPKKAPGRPRKPPGADELAAGPPLPREPDRAPQRPGSARLRAIEITRRRATGAENDDRVPPLSKASHGAIAAGVNKMYRRAGKLIRGWENGDPMGIGQAFIECTRVDLDTPEDERELTVGEAWANLARSNPRIRAFLLKVIAGGDIGDLLMAHLPIGIALVQKPWVQRWIKPEAVLESFAEPDEDEPEGSALPGGLTMPDLQEMADLTEAQRQQMMAKAQAMARRAGVHLSDGEVNAAMDAAVAKAATLEGVPPAFRRQQPKNRSRAQRTGTR